MVKLTIGERFKDARTVHNIHGNESMDKVQFATGVPKAIISALENSESTRIPGYTHIAPLAQHYGVSTDWLLGLSEDKNRNPSAVDELGLSQDSISWIKGRKSFAELSPEYSLNIFFENDSFRSLIDQLSSYVAAVAAMQIRDEVFSDILTNKEDTASPDPEKANELFDYAWDKMYSLAYKRETHGTHLSRHIAALAQLMWLSRAMPYGLNELTSSKNDYLSISSHSVEREIFKVIEDFRQSGKLIAALASMEVYTWKT